MDSVTQIERVKRVVRLKDRFGKEMPDGAVFAVVRNRVQQVKADPGERMVSFVATTEDVDVDDEVIVAAGAKADSYFFRNKSVFIDHQYDMDHFVGNARRITPLPNAGSPTAWRVQVRLHKGHPHTPSILELAGDGLIGSSIGFSRLEGGKPTAEEVKRYTKDGRKPATISRVWEWIEQSIVAMPANVNAQAVGFEDAKAALLDDLATKGRISKGLAVSLGLPATPIRKLYPTAARKRVVVVVDP